MPPFATSAGRVPGEHVDGDRPRHRPPPAGRARARHRRSTGSGCGACPRSRPSHRSGRRGGPFRISTFTVQGGTTWKRAGQPVEYRDGGEHERLTELVVPEQLFRELLPATCRSPGSGSATTAHPATAARPTRYGGIVDRSRSRSGRGTSRRCHPALSGSARAPVRRPPRRRPPDHADGSDRRRRPAVRQRRNIEDDPVGVARVDQLARAYRAGGSAAGSFSFG